MLFTPDFAFETENGIGFKHTVITDTKCGTELVWVPNESDAFDRAKKLHDSIQAAK